MFLFQVFVLVLVTSVMAEDVCPKKCFCNKQLTSVNCEGHKLSNVPDRLPKSVEKLYMTHNNIVHVNFSANVILPNLRYVWLDNNKIAGLQANAFDGSIVPKLSKLYLRNNKISVIESRTFFNMSSLTQVYLSNNDIQKIEPDAFEDTPSVQLINLDSNYLSEIPRLGKLKSLKSLYIQANQISNPTFPDDFKDLKKINDIGLSNNAIRKLDDLTFRNLQNSDVRKLEVSRSKIDEISTGAFKWLKNITSLKLGYNPLTSSDLEMAFHGLVGSSLVSLNIDNITLGGVLPSSTFQLLQNTSITTLSMKNNKMSSIPPKGFANLKKLISLDLSAANIFKIDDSAFEGLDALTRLFLNDNQLSQVPNNLPPSLQKLYLNGNQISALKDNTFMKLSKLQLLYLGGNKIHQLEQDAFYGLTSLKKIHLVDNKIHTLPGRLFESFVVLDSLELNRNNINQIPNGDSLFASMASLLYLNMADNAFSSCSFGLFKVLSSLRYLHLENNQLGDLIARDVNGNLFAGMDKLVLLNLTNNQLTQLPDPLFKDLTSLQNITMRSNKISSWGDNLYKRTFKLENLDLAQNMIALVNFSSVRDFKKMKTLDLRQNPFACTCDLRWFRDWINTTKIAILQNETYLCNSPPEWHGKRLLSFDRHKINCVWFTTTDIILAAVGGFVLLFIFFAIVYNRRWYIRLRWCRFQLSLQRYSRSRTDGYQTLDGDVYKYDAYISSVDDNYQWVLKNIFPGIDNGDLETEKFGGEFKLYFEDRDAEPGKAEVYNIVENMEASRSVIIILTREYMTKPLHEFEIITAIDLLGKRKVSDILIVNVDGLTAIHVPKLLRRKMERHDFLTWENSEEAKMTFKEQLADSLRRKRRMENVI
ncbi:slit homolog 3 protein-like isoform X2 [Mytilus californianus]|uniref:slit homolog 3 protein-like isoform X2 n=1 Tax=Mytilus californianus TaxID=6549 RepID=UPI002245B68C|nr:slit homolog 3 protein-like isoform X2 [Mytilus californianus]XP_052061823.1 slit homolog 3 protein-like isoform X2 [Mytilus californianus]XP_052061825.1 slit homolog 3 protein-like isoform X2 [Mytilus californianus]